MNKKHIVALSAASILSLTALAGCSQDVTALVENGEDVIVSIEGDGSKETYTANELFGDYLSTTSGASAAFSAVYDVLIRKGVPITQEILNEVNTQIADVKDDAANNASSNGTTYNEELSKLLESSGADDLADLQKIKELALQKTKFEDDYYDSQLFSGTMSDTIEVDTTGSQFANYYLSKEFIKNENPYHIRHILVKVSATGTSFLPSAQTISADEAKKLGNTIKDLASTAVTFSQVAQTYSDDGSVSSFGSLNEIMGRTTSYVDEFKYAVFQYDAYYNTHIEGGAEALGIPDEVRLADDNEGTTTSSKQAKEVMEESVKRVPYSVADNLIKYAEYTKDSKGDNYKDGKEIYYPRNILFNHYFNNHGLSVIVRGEDESVKTNPNFRHVEKLSLTEEAKDDVLCDEDGRPILVTRAGSGEGDSGYQGIHFIIIENSPLVNEENLSKEDYAYSVEQELKYYSIDVPRSGADISKDKRYVTFIDSGRGDYADRAGEIESAIKSYDSNIRFRLYEKILSELEDAGYTITLDEKISDSIEAYISTTRAQSELTKKENYETSWETYLRKLVTQKEFETTQIALTEIANFDDGFVADNIK